MSAGVLEFDGKLVNDNTTSVQNGTLRIAGAVSGTGTITIGTGGTLEVDSLLPKSQKIIFGAGSGTHTLNLTLIDSSVPAASISRFGVDDQIDLTAFAFSKSPTLSFNENAAKTQGTLTITDGAQTFDDAQSLNIILFGQYVATGFHSRPLGGGTEITYTPPASQLNLAPKH